MPSNKQYIAQLTFPRFLAAILVVLFHYGQKAVPFESGTWHELIKEGSIAVSFFFFLSGMVLGLNYLHNKSISYSTFVKKRLARIAPAYWSAFVFTLLTLVCIRGAVPKGISIILQVLGLHAWVPNLALGVNFTSWSVSVELFFYLLFPLIVTLFRKLSFRKQIIYTLCLYFVSFIVYLGLIKYIDDPTIAARGQFILYFPIWHLATFVFGILAGSTVIELQKQSKNYKSALLVWLASFLLSIYILSSHNSIRPYIHNGLLAPLYFLMLCGLALDRSWLSKLIAKKAFVWLGEISYSIYILQFPVFLLMQYLLPKSLDTSLAFYSYLLALVFLSALNYHFVEKKLRNWYLLRQAKKL